VCATGRTRGTRTQKFKHSKRHASEKAPFSTFFFLGLGASAGASAFFSAAGAGAAASGAGAACEQTSELQMLP